MDFIKRRDIVMIKNEIKRGDIYLADLNPVFGSEQGGYRPVLIIQNDLGNKYSPTVIVAAITSKSKTKVSTHIPLKEKIRLDKNSIILLEQIRTIEKERLESFICTLDKEVMHKVDRALRISIGLSKK